jgi:hypothetical protein
MDWVSYVAIALAVVAIAVTVGLAYRQTDQARKIAVSVYCTLDRIVQQLAEEFVLSHDVGIPIADTSVDPRFIKPTEKVKLTFSVIPHGEPLFYPDQDDTVICRVRDPEGTCHDMAFPGLSLEKDLVEYVFPDDFKDVGGLRGGLYEVRWIPRDEIRPERTLIYGFNTFYVVPS